MAWTEKLEYKSGTKWRVIWRQDGKRHNETFNTEQDAATFKQLVKAHGGQWPAGWSKGHGYTSPEHADSPTYHEWAKHSIELRAGANERTRHDYQRDYRNHIQPTFAHRTLGNITRTDVITWIRKLQTKKLAAKTIKNIHGLASSIMDDALNEGHITRNVFAGAATTIPTVKTEEMVFLTRPELKHLTNQMPTHWRPIPWLLAETGLRWSELTALQTKHVELLQPRKTITIIQAWKRQPDNTHQLGEPKTARARRTIVLSDLAVQLLAEATAGKRGNDFVLTTKYGFEIMHSNFYANAWLPAVARAQTCPTHYEQQLPTKHGRRWKPEPCHCPGTLSKTPRIHDLRHTHASWLLTAGVPIHAVSRRMGHASITTTVDRYGHLDPRLDDDIVAALNQQAQQHPQSAPATVDTSGSAPRTH